MQRKIVLNTPLSLLDEFVFDFVDCLEKVGIRYVIISGYVAIALGRSRATEDVDIFIRKVTLQENSSLWTELNKKFECLNAFSAHEAFEFLDTGTALRFFQKGGEWEPNVEVKVVKNDLDKNALENPFSLVLRGKTLKISPLEQQIAFKLYLGSEKDEEDALHLYVKLCDFLDKSLLMNYCSELNVEKEKVMQLEEKKSLGAKFRP